MIRRRRRRRRRRCGRPADDDAYTPAALTAAAAPSAAATAAFATVVSSSALTGLALDASPSAYRLLGSSRWGGAAGSDGGGGGGAAAAGAGADGGSAVPSVPAADDRVVDDLAAFRGTCQALVALGCGASEIESLFRLLACLLHLGNAAFEDGDDGYAKPSAGGGAAAVAAAGAAVDCDDLSDLLLHRSLAVGGEQVRIDLRAEQAEHLLAGLGAHTLGFSWVVRQVNTALAGDRDEGRAAARRRGDGRCDGADDDMPPPPPPPASR